MKSFSLTAISLLALSVERASTAKLYLAGDSTMANGGSGSGLTQGWGQYLQYSVTLEVVNDAIAGRSARSYTEEGRFQDIADVLASGDFVIIEFGHNDGGTLSTTVDNLRTDCYGAGTETCVNGTGAIIQTYPTYITEAGDLFKSLGATVIVSSPTPDNPWETGTFTYTASRFTSYGDIAATNIGGNTGFVDHGQYTANIFDTLGETAVDAFYPSDHTHTSPAGADVVAKAFVKGVLCANDALATYVKNTTASVEGNCI